MISLPTLLGTPTNALFHARRVLIISLLFSLAIALHVPPPARLSAAPREQVRISDAVGFMGYWNGDHHHHHRNPRRPR